MVNSLESAVAIARENSQDETFVIGGAEITRWAFLLPTGFISLKSMR